jgi:hypothetical protein
MNEEFKRDLFLDRKFDANSFEIGNVKINSSVQDIDTTEITDIFVNYSGYQNLNFTERLKLLKDNSGWIHYATGAAFQIENGIVKQIKLSTLYLLDNNISKSDLINIFGIPDIELVDDICHSVIANIDAYILVFRQKKIYAFIDPNTEILKELHFGSLDEKIYSQKIESEIHKEKFKSKRNWWGKLFGF